MKLWKAILTSICILPLAIISHAEDVNTQNLRISETSMMSVNHAAPSSMQQKVPTDNKSSAINNSNDVEVDKEEGFRWPWQSRKDKALEAIEDFKNQPRP